MCGKQTHSFNNLQTEDILQVQLARSQLSWNMALNGLIDIEGHICQIYKNALLNLRVKDIGFKDLCENFTDVAALLATVWISQSVLDHWIFKTGLLIMPCIASVSYNEICIHEPIFLTGSHNHSLFDDTQKAIYHFFALLAFKWVWITRGQRQIFHHN